MATLDDLFNLEVSTVYQLTWEDEGTKAAMKKALEDGKLYRFVFNYRADYEGADAVVIASHNEVFVLTGRMLEFNYLENKIVVVVEETVQVAQEEEDVDFGML